MSLIIAGNPSPIANPVETIRRRRGGSEFIHSWTGAADSVRAMEASLLSSGAVEVQVTQQPGSALATIRAHFASAQNGEPEDVQETLEINFSSETFPINVHPAFIDIDEDVIKYLEDIANDANRPIDETTGDAHGQYYMRLIRRHETSYRAFLPNLTYVREVSEQSAHRVNCENNGKIYTKAEVAAALAAPIVFTIPETNVGIRAASRYIIGYQFTGSVEFTSSGRVRLVENYNLGRFDRVIAGIDTIA